MSLTRVLTIRVDETGTAKSGLADVTGSLGGLGAIAGGVVVAGLASAGTAAVAAGIQLNQLGSDTQEMQSMFDTVFSTVGGDVTDSLDEFGNTVGRSTFALQEMAAGFGDTLKPMGFAEEDAGELSVTLTELATDLESFKNLPAQEAFERLQGTLIGNHENALAFGVIINENTLKTELAAMGADKLTGAELEQAKVQARINLLIKGTADAQGDAERTAGGWANQQRALDATLDETGRTLGLMLVPATTEVLTAFNQLATDVLPPALDLFQETSGEVAEILGPSVEELGKALTELAQAFGINTEEVDAADVVLGIIKISLEGVKGVAHLLAWEISLVSNQVETMKDTVEVATDIIDWATDAWDAGFSAVGDTVDWLSEQFEDFESSITEVAEAMPSWLIPGSPTPFEIGLRGIADASTAVNDALPPAFSVNNGTGPLPPIQSSPTQQQPVTIEYRPLLSTSDQHELERNLAPIIENVLRSRGL